jgi:hypothetical protein
MSSGPWQPRPIAGWAIGTVAAAVVLTCCWYSISGERTFDDQRSALDLAVMCVVAVNVAGAALLISGRRAVGVRSRLLLAGLPDSQPARTAAEPLHDLSVVTALVGGTGLTRYHRQGCQIATGRDWAQAPRATHEQEGRMPCGVCRP